MDRDPQSKSDLQRKRSSAPDRNPTKEHGIGMTAARSLADNRFDAYQVSQVSCGARPTVDEPTRWPRDTGPKPRVVRRSLQRLTSPTTCSLKASSVLRASFDDLSANCDVHAQSRGVDIDALLRHQTVLGLCLVFIGHRSDQPDVRQAGGCGMKLFGSKIA